MIVYWDNPDGTYVRIEDEGSIYQIPTDDRHPKWREVKALVAKGELTIQPYQAPASDQTEE
jgi:hypothetical protein